MRYEQQKPQQTTAATKYAVKGEGTDLRQRKARGTLHRGERVEGNILERREASRVKRYQWFQERKAVTTGSANPAGGPIL